MRKKFLQGVTTLGIMTAICMAFGVVTASAETLDKGNIAIDYNAQKIIVDIPSTSTTPTPPTTDGDGAQTREGSTDATTASDREILFGVSTTPNKTTKKFKTSSWEVYEVEEGQAVIDISSLNTQKDNYMQIKGDVSSDPITICIPATDKTLKLKYDAVKSELVFRAGADTSKKAENLQYRTQYGSHWEDFTDEDKKPADLSIYQQRGATLYFRLKTNGDDSYTTLEDQGTEDATVLKDTTVVKEGVDTKAIKMPSLPGKEIKVAVSKMANGPKVAVDYLKNTVKIPNKAQYRIIANGAEIGEFGAAVSAATTLEADKIADLLDGGSIEIRNAATTTKPASKITHVSFKEQDVTEVAATAGGEANADVTKNKVDGAVTANLTSVTRGTTTKYTLELTCTSDDKYEVFVKGATDAAPKLSDTRGRKTLTKKSVLKLANVEDKSKIWIHKAGDKKNAIWATNYVEMGAVAYPAGSGDDTGDDDNKDAVTETDLDALAAQLIVDNNGAANAQRVKGENAGDYLAIFKTDATVTLGESAEYTLESSSKKLPGVTAEIVLDTSVDETDQEAFPFLEVDAKGLKVKELPTDQGSKSGTVQLKLSAGNVSKNYPIYVRVVDPNA